MTADVARAAEQQEMVDDFNSRHHIGVKVYYWKGLREGRGTPSWTRTPAQLLSGHTAVVWVEGVGSCISLTHIQTVED